VTRVLSGAVLLAFAVTMVWLAPAPLFLIVAEVLVVLACAEYAGLAHASGLSVPVPLATGASVVTAAAFARLSPGNGPLLALDAILMTALVTLGAASLLQWKGGQDAVASASSTIFPALYLGLPVGAMLAIRETWGPDALFLLMLTVFSSDTAQYYTGRAFGRRPLAPVISPKKTVEGAVGGFVCGGIVLAVVGAWWLPAVPLFLRIVLGITVVALGIAGDLFESMLKRSAGVKDSSALIPGHGGVLDRIDALLFAAPIYFVVLKYV
jgi:phosphatidate cytidylyltransferase